jgi:50S ribosomal protein L16 3-hydroxylase
MLEALDIEGDKKNTDYYIDPNWSVDMGKSEISKSSINQALKLLNFDELPIDFFGCFITKLDPFDQQKFNEIMAFEKPIKIEESERYILAPLCRIAYQIITGNLYVYINGELFNTEYFDDDLVINFCNSRELKVNKQNKLLAKSLSSFHLLEKISNHL